MVKAKNKNMEKMLRGFMCYIAWIGGRILYEKSPCAAALCLQKLLKICNNEYEIASWLIRSQSDESYIPVANADWLIINEAIYLLKQNAKQKGVQDLLNTLKSLGKYDAVL